MSDRDFKEDLLAALRTRIKTAHPSLDVRVGWVGAAKFPEGDSVVLSLQPIGEPRRVLSNAVAKSFTTPADEAPAISELTIDYGHATLPIVATLYVVAEREALRKRGEWVSKIEALFPLEPGQPQALALTLPNRQQTRVRLVYEQANDKDEAEGVQRNEWRSDIRMTASFALTGLREYPFCRNLVLIDESENEISVDGVVAPES